MLRSFDRLLNPLRILHTTWPRTVLVFLLLSGIVLLTLYLRWPVVGTNNFQNEDVAGITYNADLLRRGYVPLVDSVETKAPLSFFVTSWVWKLWGRSMGTLESFGVAWALCGTLFVFLVGWQLHSVASGILAALLYTLYSPITDSITMNYNTWMMPPYIGCTALFIAGLRRGHWGWFFATGFAIAIAGLFRHQGATIVPLFGGILLLGPLLSRPVDWAKPRRAIPILACTLGCCFAFALMTIYYAGRGDASAFLKHFFASDSGWRYVQGEADLDRWIRFEDGLLGLLEFMSLPMLLTTLTLVGIRLDRRQGPSLSGVLLGGHLLFSFLGASIGLRYYTGYYLQLLPAACWLASHPDGPLLRWFRASTTPLTLSAWISRSAMVICLIACLIPSSIQGVTGLKQIRRERKNYNAHQRETLKIGKIIKENTDDVDRIWVWGRWAWPVYFHADRLSVTPYYKVMNIITNTLTNTWKRPTVQTRFIPMGPWEEIGRQLTEGKPKFIVVSRNEIYRGFTPFEELLRASYHKMPNYYSTSFEFYRHNDLDRKSHTSSEPAAIPSTQPTLRPLAPTKLIAPMLETLKRKPK